MCVGFGCFIAVTPGVVFTAVDLLSPPPCLTLHHLRRSYMGDRLKLPDGKFASGLPPCYSSVRGVLLKRSQGDAPYYMTAPKQYYKDGMLPKVKEVFGDVCPRRINPTFGPWVPAARSMITRVLDFLGTILHPIAKRKSFTTPDGELVHTAMRGAEAFKYPLAKEASGQQVCMVYKVEKARETKHIYPLKSGYITVVLGYKGKGVQVLELAHRLVLWAIKGPPPTSMMYPVAMHTCNNKSCLNPMHMMWGENKDNIRMP